MVRERTTDGPLVVYGINPVQELLRGDAPVTRVYVGPGPQHEALAAAARGRGAAVEVVGRPVLDRLAGTHHHQGAVAVTAAFRYAPLDHLLGPRCASALVLDGVQDPRNLGAILRTARAAGVEGVVLPQDGSVGVTPVVVAASTGALFGLPIARVPNLVRGMGAMKEAGYWMIGLSPAEERSLYGIATPPRPALVVGGEGRGIRSLVRRTCDFTVSLPMAPGVESLNVSVAVGIALYELLVRRASP